MPNYLEEARAAVPDIFGEARRAQQSYMGTSAGADNRGAGLNPNSLTLQSNWVNPNPNYPGNRAPLTYSGEGGTFVNTGGGWQSPSGMGPQINDLPAFLQMRQRQNIGSDFSNYQNRLLDTLNQQNDWQSRLNRLLTDPTSFEETPAYKAAFQQGQQAIERSAAAKGMLNSGNVLAALAKYGSDMASQEYGNQISRLGENVNRYGATTNQLANLLSNAQNFGVRSGYYEPEQYTPTLGTNFGNTMVRPSPASEPQAGIWSTM